MRSGILRHKVDAYEARVALDRDARSLSRARVKNLNRKSEASYARHDDQRTRVARRLLLSDGGHCALSGARDRPSRAAARGVANANTRPSDGANVTMENMGR